MMKKCRNLLVCLILVAITACSQPYLTEVIEVTPDELVILLSPTATSILTPTPVIQPEGLVSEGEFALFVGDYDRALGLFLAMPAQSADERLVGKRNLGIGQAHFALRNYAAALNAFRQAAALENEETAARASYLLGNTYTTLQRFDEALLAYEGYLTTQPGRIDSHVHELRGDVFSGLGNHAEAITSYEKAYRTHPDGGTEALAVKVARAYEANGDEEHALALYREINTISYNDYTKATMGLLIGRIYLERDEPEQAIPYLQEVVNQYPFAFDAHTALVILLNQGVAVDEFQRGLVNHYANNHILAVEAFERFLADAPSDRVDEALHFKALSTRATGSRDNQNPYFRAIALWETLIEEHPTSQYYSNAWLGIEFTLRGFLNEPLQAASISVDYVAQRPEAADAPDFLFLAGRALERANELRNAAETWARVGTEYPAADEAFRASYFSGIAFVRLEDWPAAQLQFSRALVLAGEPSEVAAAHLWIGKCQYAQGEISTALDSWKVAQAENPFGHYGIRAEDLLIGREPFTEPETFDLDPDLSPFRAEAEAWVRFTFNISPETNLESPGILAYDPRFQRGKEFWALGDYETAKIEFEALRIELAEDPAETFRLIPALVDIGLYRSALIASTQLLRLAGLERAAALDAPEYFSRIRFGAYYLDWLIPVAEAENMSPLIILSTIRQESAYESFARSVAGARGLMQVMPDTGKELAAQLNWPEDYCAEDLYRPYVSLVFGTNYLRRWLRYFESDNFAMLAAYNGGPGNMMTWQALNPSGDPDLLLEIIHLEETRVYIRVINEIHYIYRWLYGSPMEP